MPHSSSLGLDLNPSREPLRYPGGIPRESFLLAGHWLYRLHPRPNRELAEWGAEIDGGPLGEVLDRGSVALDTLLRRAGSALVGERFPVAAVGSNASPGQLSHKFGSGAHPNGLVPATRATATGLTVSHSAHVSTAGYVPYVPLAAEGNREELFVLWLTSAQLEELNATEPNYHLVDVGKDAASASLESGEQLESFGMYRGRWGALRAAPGSPPVRARSQTGLLEALASVQPLQPFLHRLGTTPGAIVRSFARSERRRADFHRLVVLEGLAAEDGFESLGLGSWNRR